jgi:hypothetical protein
VITEHLGDHMLVSLYKTYQSLLAIGMMNHAEYDQMNHAEQNNQESREIR